MRVYTSRCGKSAMGFIHHVPHMGAGVSGELRTQYAHNQVQLTHRGFDVGAGLVTLLMLPEPVKLAGS